MAKQSGLHQIKGKIGEYSYYKQTGVSGGLIRGINQGMSARVKADAAYANTRLNNREFGAAANTASLLGQMVTPKFRPMILPFSQSKMAKEVLKLARQNVNPWGQRTVTNAQTAQLAAILSAQSKRDVSEFVELSLTRTASDEAVAGCSYSPEQATLMAGLGITNLTVTAIQFDLGTGNWNAIAQEMATGYFVRNDSVSVVNDESVVAGAGTTASESLDVAAFVPAPNHSGHQIVVFVVLPAREINGVSHILQEYCSFAAFELPAAA
jgi:hypothetical protein